MSDIKQTIFPDSPVPTTLISIPELARLQAIEVIHLQASDEDQQNHLSHCCSRNDHLHIHKGAKQAESTSLLNQKPTGEESLTNLAQRISMLLVRLKDPVVQDNDSIMLEIATIRYLIDTKIEVELRTSMSTMPAGPLLPQSQFQSQSQPQSQQLFDGGPSSKQFSTPTTLKRKFSWGKQDALAEGTRRETPVEMLKKFFAKRTFDQKFQEAEQRRYSGLSPRGTKFPSSEEESLLTGKQPPISRAKEPVMMNNVEPSQVRARNNYLLSNHPL
ncbi:MAG: hypothetical protein Q9182_000317 [Xanthomendoza sp. 2 TL-2023]